jgi:hypothetical protein
MGNGNNYNSPSKSSGGYFRADANLSPAAGRGGDAKYQKKVSAATKNQQPTYKQNTNPVSKQGSLGKQGRFGK